MQIECEVPLISVIAPDPQEARRACAVASSADTRLRSLGLKLTDGVRVEVTADLDVAPEACVAFYSTETRRLQVLTVDCLEEQPGRAKAFPKMSADLLFESLILHELVHAYAEQSSAGRFLPRVAHEFLAYAIQLDALPEAERRRILKRSEVSEPVDPAQLNEAVLGLSPLRFAAASWLHFRAEGADAALVARVLDGSLAFYSLRE